MKMLFLVSKDAPQVSALWCGFEMCITLNISLMSRPCWRPTAFNRSFKSFFLGFFVDETTQFPAKSGIKWGPSLFLSGGDSARIVNRCLLCPTWMGVVWPGVWGTFINHPLMPFRCWGESASPFIYHMNLAISEFSIIPPLWSQDAAKQTVLKSKNRRIRRENTAKTKQH